MFAITSLLNCPLGKSWTWRYFATLCKITQHRKTLLQLTKPPFYYNTFSSQVSIVRILLRSGIISVWSHKPWGKSSINRISKEKCIMRVLLHNVINAGIYPYTRVMNGARPRCIDTCKLLSWLHVACALRLQNLFLLTYLSLFMYDQFKDGVMRAIDGAYGKRKVLLFFPFI
nr:unnamed protein product [Callosobruchus analis]